MENTPRTSKSSPNDHHAGSTATSSDLVTGHKEPDPTSLSTGSTALIFPSNSGRLPTQCELAHSKKLIAEWQKELHQVEQSIVSVLYQGAPNQWTTATNGRRTRATDSASATMKAEALSSTLDTLEWEGSHEEPLQSLINKWKTLKEQLMKERAFIAPIRKLSLEILIEIFHHTISHTFHSVPNRKIALVCKEWHDVLLGTPSLWTEIDADWIRTMENPSDTLKRRIRLSGSAQLDITISYRVEESIPNLHKILADSGVERWRTLHLDRFSTAMSREEEICWGNFRSLRSLTIGFYSVGGEIPCAFLRRIAQTASNLRSFRSYGGGRIPTVLMETGALSRLTSINHHSIPSDCQINFEQLKILKSSSYHGTPPILLPPSTHFGRCNFVNLLKCRFEKVTQLTIAMRDDLGSSHPPLEIPQLISLTLQGPNVFDCLLDLSAPKLKTLVLIDNPIPPPNGKRDRDLRDHSRAASDTFNANISRLRVVPVNLDLSLRLKTISTLLILKTSTQIQNLKLHWSRHFRWEGRFVNALCSDKGDPVCPDLISLRVRMEDKEDGIFQRWKEGAERIMRSRVESGLPLREIVWTGWVGFGDWECIGAEEFRQD